MMRRPAPLLLWLLLASAPVSAGTLRGSLLLPAGTPRALLEDAVVWLERIPERTERLLAHGRPASFFRYRVPPAPDPRLVARDLRYEPRVVVVAAGDSLEIRNEDHVWHGTFSVSPEHAFEIGKRPPGAADTVRFLQPGLIQVRCDIHPDMSATVFVTPNHAFARTDSAGTWRLPKLPPGDYVLRAWAPGLREWRQPVTVQRRVDTVVEVRWSP
jgi:hypothetical protein